MLLPHFSVHSVCILIVVDYIYIVVFSPFSIKKNISEVSGEYYLNLAPVARMQRIKVPHGQGCLGSGTQCGTVALFNEDQLLMLKPFNT